MKAATKLVIPGWVELDPHEIQRKIEQMERDTIYQVYRKECDNLTEKQMSSPWLRDWVSLKTSIAYRGLVDHRDGNEVIVTATTRPAVERVWVPAYKEEMVPGNTKYCDYCHGYTRNDSRGNCAACGAPRRPRWETIKRPWEV